MGYYTYVSLYTDTVEQEDQIMKWIEEYRKLPGKDDFLWGLNEESKWYDDERHPEMVELSKQFPEILITLEGKGEEWDDIWREYYLNGQFYSESAQIKFNDFDSSLLKNLQ